MDWLDDSTDLGQATLILARPTHEGLPSTICFILLYKTSHKVQNQNHQETQNDKAKGKDTDSAMWQSTILNFQKDCFNDLINWSIRSCYLLNNTRTFWAESSPMESYTGTSLGVYNKGTNCHGLFSPKLLVLQVGFFVLQVVRATMGNTSNTIPIMCFLKFPFQKILEEKV